MTILGNNHALFQENWYLQINGQSGIVINLFDPFPYHFLPILQTSSGKMFPLHFQTPSLNGGWYVQLQ